MKKKINKQANKRQETGIRKTEIANEKNKTPGREDATTCTRRRAETKSKDEEVTTWSPLYIDPQYS